MRLKKGLKKWYKVIFLLILVLVAIFFWPKRKFNLEGVEYIKILDPNHQTEWKTITRETDNEQVEEIIKRTEALNLYRHFTIFGRGGFSISINFYDADGQLIDSYAAITEHKVGADSGKEYFAIFSKVDIAYYEALCAE